MKLAEALLAFGMAIAWSGCSLHKQPAVKAAPPAPNPVATPAPPAPPPEPLSIPQTTVELPRPQPITPEALATTQPPGEPAPPAPPPTQPRRPPSRGGAPARTEPPAPAPAPVVPTVPAAEADRPPVVDVLSPAEQKRLQDEFESRRQDVRKLVEQAGANLNPQQRATVDRISSFLKQAEEAEQRKEMRQASELAGRALVLAKELK